MKYLPYLFCLSLLVTIPVVEAKPPPDEPFLVMNGDLLTTVNLQKMVKYHTEQNADFTLGTRTMSLPLEYGVVTVEKNRIVRMDEKPDVTMDNNAGVYVLSPSVLSSLPPGRVMMTGFIHTIFTTHQVLRYHLDGVWLDVGRMVDYERANKEWSDLLHD